MDYVPNTSFAVLDGEKPWGIMTVEPNHNRLVVRDRSHFILDATNLPDKHWYDLLWANCKQMYDEGALWDWVVPKHMELPPFVS